MRVVVKIGGALLDSAEGRVRLACEIGQAARGGARAVVVHGGGRQMTQFLSERGVESRFVDGLRVTTPEVLDAVLKVLAGSVNRQLVAAFVECGVKAVGLTGMDALLTEAEPLDAALGWVGRPVRSNPALLELLAAHGYLPVVACVAGDRRGRFFNVNADEMAASCAAAFGAEKLIFLTDVEGVRGRDGAAREVLAAAESRSLIEEGVAAGGMRAKLEAALGALASGVADVIIAPGARPGIVAQLLSGAGAGPGTRLTRDSTGAEMPAVAEIAGDA